MKTLKDLIKKVKIKAVIENTNKWGTIPMIQINNSSLVAEQITTEVDWNELKALAIKWVHEEGNIMGLLTDSCKRWMKRLNLTEEDLNSIELEGGKKE